jgi:zeaxanthin epoxidase
VRSAAVQGLSRFASDIIILGFDTPAKIVRDENGKIRFENFNYAGIVTKMMQPILPLFFNVQFNFLYDGWRNEMEIDLPAAFGFLTLGSLLLLLGLGSLGEAGIGLGLGAEALFGAEGLLDLDAISTAVRSIFLES